MKIQVEKIAHGGEGIGRLNGRALFIEGALPGETVRIELLPEKKGVQHARLIQILTPSPERQTPPCSIYDACGGCSVQHLHYEGQLKAKEERVREALSRIAGLSETLVLPIVKDLDPFGYRQKTAVPLQQGPYGLQYGFYKKGSHEIIPMDQCHIAASEHQTILEVVKKIANHLQLPGYDERTDTGLLRHAVIRTGYHTQEKMLVLVLTKPMQYTALIEAIQKELGPDLSFHVNIQPKPSNTIFGSKFIHLSGPKTIHDHIGKLKFNISPASFFQVNPPMAEKLYQIAKEYAQLQGEETVLDAYSGTGTIALYLADKAKWVTGIEVVQQAVLDARRNQEENHIKNANFLLGTPDSLLKEKNTTFDVIITDPPRKGLEPKALETLAKLKAKRFIYVSCDPSTLARDLKQLSHLGYKVEKVQPVDMFPQTMHVECVVSLVKEFNL